MSDQQVVLTLRIPGDLLDRLQTVARRLDGVRRSRSDAARYALENGLRHIEEELGICDGNKRIAAVAMGTFLEINGYPLRVDEVELYRTMMALAEGRIDKAELTAWLREKIRTG